MKQKFIEIQEYIKANKHMIFSLRDYAQVAFILIFVSYIAASIVSSFTTLVLLSVTNKSVNIARITTPSSTPSLNFSNNFNYRDLRVAVMDRNIFNSDGEFPKEELDSATDIAGSSFNNEAVCRTNTLGLKLVGIIAMNNGKSVAVIREESYAYPDVYREGDPVVDGNGAIIYQVGEDNVVINNNGSKECLELPKGLAIEDDSMDFAQQGGSSKKGNSNAAAPSPECESIMLTESYVREELGDGFARILNRGRLIPHPPDGAQITGFKVANIQPGSLFDKICIKNGDIITQVNDISLQQPDQGFAFYEAFQNERDIRISVIRDGTPMSIGVHQTR